jgi:hypothetical protein
MPQFSDSDTTYCCWETVSPLIKQIIIISVYWNINTNLIPSKLIYSVKHCIDNNIPYICGMDSNAWSSLWGCTTENERGETMEE